jgi:hypothetical protein
MAKTPSLARIKPRVGDIFLIPVDESISVYGQILTASNRTHLVVVYKATSLEGISSEEVIAREIDLAGMVFDAKFINGDWPIVGNLPPIQVAEPWFVEGHEGMEDLSLTNLDMSERRRVNPREAEAHPARHLSYPMRLQKAVAGLRGLSPWQEGYHGHFRELAKELTRNRPKD